MAQQQPLETKVLEFLKQRFINDPDTFEELSDPDIISALITTLKSTSTVAAARNAILTAFEVEDDELPLGELDSQALYTIIHQHKVNILSKLSLGGEVKQEEGGSHGLRDQNDVTNIKTDPNGDIDAPLQCNQNAIERAYQTYQAATHSDEAEKRKGEFLAENEDKKNALLKALGGQNGTYSASAATNIDLSGVEFVSARMKEALQPKTAFQMAFGAGFRPQDELSQFSKTDEKMISQLAKQSEPETKAKRLEMLKVAQAQKQAEKNLDKSEERRNGSLSSGLSSSSSLSSSSGTIHDRDRNREYDQGHSFKSEDNHNNTSTKHNTNPNYDPYLAVAPAVTEFYPTRFGIYRAVVNKADKDKYSVTLIDFEKKVQGTLLRNQATSANGDDNSSYKRDLAENTQIWVKVLSDYFQLYKEESARQRYDYEKKMQTIANDVETLKRHQKDQIPITVIVTVTMKDVDQVTGQDLDPMVAANQQISSLFGGGNKHLNQNSYATARINAMGTAGGTTTAPSTQMVSKRTISGLSRDSLERVLESGKSLTKSEHEQWTLSKADNGLDGTGYGQHSKRKQTRYDDSDDELIGGKNSMKNDPYMIELSDDDDHVDIDLNDSEPGFLRGFNTNLQALVQESYEATRLTQNECGALTTMAKKQSENAKERRQLRQDRVKDAVANEMALVGNDTAQKGWADPLHLAQEQSKYGNDNNVIRPMFAQQQESAIQSRLLDQQRQNELDAAGGSLFGNRKQKVVSYGKNVSASIKEQRESLPVFKLRDEFLEVISKSQICIVVGETGSGKTTQMGQYLLEAGYGRRGVIGCTQPRRVAATSVAERVAEEVGCELGTVVGYSVRFEDKTTPQTRIRYMTDGLLLREILIDPILSRYSVMIIDEAHERGVNTDILLALIKAACRARPDLKFIVTSATLDSKKFSAYFNDCPVFSIPGRTYPVQTHYTNEQCDDYFEEAMRAVLKIHVEKAQGDILLFLTGEEEINDAVETLTEQVDKLREKQGKNGSSIPPLDVYPIFSSLPNEIQSLIFEPTPPGRRKCVVATNIAEASVTIDGIVFVVDTGVCKVAVYDAKQGIESLQVTPISQAQARQRAGRAGRTQPGECYRLYTEASFNEEMTPTTVPELQRCDLTSVILLLKALGINDLLGFDFIDPPASSSMLLALRQLFWLGAIDDDGLLTEVGSKLAMLPLPPNLGKMLLVAVDLGCVQEVTTVVALVSGDDLWLRPKSDLDKADRAKASMNIKVSDHATLVNVFMKWEKEGKTKEWCKRNFIASRALETGANVRLQLLRTLSNMQVELSSCGKNWALIARAVTAGLFMNAAKLERQDDKQANKIIITENKTVDVYKSLTYGTSAPIHPSSAMANEKPDFIVYQKMLLTTKEWLHTCTRVHPQWLVQLAPHLYAEKNLVSSSTKHNKTKLDELTDKFHAKGAWRLENRAG